MTKDYFFLLAVLPIWIAIYTLYRIDCDKTKGKKKPFAKSDRTIGLLVAMDSQEPSSGPLVSSESSERSETFYSNGLPKKRVTKRRKTTSQTKLDKPSSWMEAFPLLAKLIPVLPALATVVVGAAHLLAKYLHHHF